MRRLSLNLALLCLSMIAALGFGELATRWVFRDVTSPMGTWFGARWKAEHLRRNELGYRDRPIPVERPPGERRILVIGDSFTVAMGLAEEDRYTERIERALNERGGGFRVLQFAAPGQNLDGHLATLRDRGLEVEPDFILLQWYVNDVEVGDPPVSGGSLPIPLGRLDAWLSERSALYSAARLQWRTLRFRLGLLQDYGDYTRERFSDPSGELRQAMDLLRRFLAVSGRAGVPVAIVLFPHLTEDLGAGYPFAFLHERVLAECRLYAIPCVDLRASFAGQPPERLRLNRFDHHPSALAHELAAEALMQALGEQWLGLSTREGGRASSARAG